MTEREKLNAILQKLYELRDDGDYHALEEVMKSVGFYSGREEEWRLARNLESKKFIEAYFIAAETGCKITSEGIDHVENPPAPRDSSSKFVTNVSGVENLIINQATTNTTINQNFQGEAQKLVDQFKMELERTTVLDQGELNDLRECIEEIESKIQEQKRVPNFVLSNFVLSNFVTKSAEIATLGGLAIQIAQVLGYLPK